MLHFIFCSMSSFAKESSQHTVNGFVIFFMPYTLDTNIEIRNKSEIQNQNVSCGSFQCKRPRGPSPGVFDINLWVIMICGEFRYSSFEFVKRISAQNGSVDFYKVRPNGMV